MIHSVDISNYSLDQRLNVKLENALLNVKNKLVNTREFQHEDVGRKPEKIYTKLILVIMSFSMSCFDSQLRKFCKQLILDFQRAKLNRNYDDIML